MPIVAKLLSVACAVPPFLIDQADATILARTIFGARFDEFERLSKVFETSGIRQRSAARPIEWYMTPKGWPERAEAYRQAADDLFAQVAAQAIEKAGLTPQDIATIVTVSSTGISTPSLEARVLDRVGFKRNVSRIPVFGLGCAGGVSGLSIAARLAEARPGTAVLLVALELCTLSFRSDQLTKANIVATALFGDGAAACVVRAGEQGLASLAAVGEYTWEDTLGIMGWSVDQQGLGVIFDRTIPPFVERYLEPAIKHLLAQDGRRWEDIDRLIAHPGGTKVVEAIERAFELPDGSLDHERAVLAEHGNMSAPTVFFVLERVLKAGLPKHTLLTALGPGFTTSCVSLTRS